MGHTDQIQCAGCEALKTRWEFDADRSQKDGVEQPCLECKAKIAKIAATDRGSWGNPPK